MELGTTYLILAYVGPICGIMGFIITPGLTHIRPWLMEKFKKEKQEIVAKTLFRDYRSMSYDELIDEKDIFNKNHRFDWRPKISKIRRELKHRVVIARWNKAMSKEDECDK